MKYILLICVSVFFLKVSGNNINVGTVLFSESDNLRKCWTAEQLALLRARYVYQDVLPKYSILTMNNDKFVAGLITYFRMAMEKIKAVTSGKTKQINMQAIADAIGGYIYHIVYPVGKDAFYWGRICFDSVDQIRSLLDEIKLYLKTDGSTWSSPILIPKRTRKDIESIRSIPIKEGCGCEGLIFNALCNTSLEVPMPFMDSKVNPSSIAMPFRNYPLRSLKNCNCGNLLWEFYYSVLNCMNEKNVDDDSKKKFYDQYSTFIEQEVIPHLNDDDLYTCFGGVYKLREALQNGGRMPSKNAGAASNVLMSLEGEPQKAGAPLLSSEEDFYGDEEKSTTIIFIAVGIVILIWIITGIIFCCCRKRRKKDECWARVPPHAAPCARPPPKCTPRPGGPPPCVDSYTETPTPPCRTTSTQKTSSPLTCNSRICKPRSITTIRPPTPSPTPTYSPSYKSPSISYKSPSPETSPESPPSPPRSLTPPPRSPTPVSPSPTTTTSPTVTTSPSPPPKPKRRSTRRKSAWKDCYGDRAPGNNQPCPKCNRRKCVEHISASCYKSVSVKDVISEPRIEGVILHGDTIMSGARLQGAKPVVFGYDFETSNSDSSDLSSSTEEIHTPRTVI